MFVFVSCLWPMGFLCLWLMMIKCLVAILHKNCFHERGRDTDRERGGRETHHSYVWLEREREKEITRERAPETCVRVYAYRCFVGSFPSALALSQSLFLTKEHLSQDGNVPLHHQT